MKYFKFPLGHVQCLDTIIAQSAVLLDTEAA